MADMKATAGAVRLNTIEVTEETKKLKSGKFSEFPTSPIVSVYVGLSTTFFLHSQLLVTESEQLSKALDWKSREAADLRIELPDEDPDIFGYFVEYLYRNQSVLSRVVDHYSKYVTLARLYALGDRLLSHSVQSIALWRFTENLNPRTEIPDSSLCKMLRIACEEIPEKIGEDPMRASIFWFAANQISKLQKCDMFRQLLRERPELGVDICMWVNKGQPAQPSEPIYSKYERFKDETEYGFDN